MENRLKSTKGISNYQPARELELFCYSLVSVDVKGNKEAAERLSGIKKGRFDWAWKTKPEFREWYLKLCIDVLSTNAAIPPYALMGAILDKDVPAIRLYYELIGQLKGSGVNIHNTQHIQTFVYLDPKAVQEANAGSNRIKSELPTEQV